MTSIPEFLRGKVLLVTGGTGFVAKAVVEKVLRYAPEVQQVYLLIRPSHRSGRLLSADDRLEREVLTSSAFSRLRKQWGEDYDRKVREKVTAVSFDLTQDRLGITTEEYARLTQDVDIVISVAATVRFDEPIDLALKTNTLGPRRAVELARACRDAILVHVSTAYVNGQMTGRIPEKTLSPDLSMAQVIGNGQAADYDLEAQIAAIERFGVEVEKASHTEERKRSFLRTLDRQNQGKRVTEHRVLHQLEALRTRWVRKQLVQEGVRRGRELGWHDSYSLTKAMGEQIVVKTRGDLPTAIVRPSIIESSLEDPEPGWIDGLKVADPLINHFSKGRLPDFPAPPGNVIDVIPVDLVANAIIAVLPTVRSTRDIQVYHVGTSSTNPLLVEELFDFVYEYFTKNPMLDRGGAPIPVGRWKFTGPKALLRRYRLKYQIPLIVLQWTMDHTPILPWPPRLRRRVSVLEATLERILSLIETYSPYTQLECIFETENLRRLQSEMSLEDRKALNCDVSRIRWREYIQDIHVPGLKRHILKAS